MSDRRLAELAERYGLVDEAVLSLRALLDLLADARAPTSVHDPVAGIDVHVADSLAGLEVAQLREAETIADLGAGAGLPGLVIAAARRDARVTLVESVGRKCAFIERAVGAMALANAEVACCRAEQWRGGPVAAVTVRALATLPVLVEYAAPLLRDDGALVAWKGAVAAEEEADGVAAAALLGLERAEVRPVAPYPGSEQRTLHIFRKVAPTPAGYPRRPGMAAKRPLRAR